MKSTLLFRILFTGLLFAAFTASAQNYDRETNPDDWEIGLNTGFAFQEGDIRVAPGWGVGLTLGKTLYRTPRGFLDLGLRGRLLYTQTYGRDFVRSTGIENNTVFNGTRADELNYLLDPGYVYQNHKSHIGEASIEGVLTFNKLRERTGAILSLYGGLGIDFYQTNTDQLDFAGNMYDYSAIDPTDRKGTVLNELAFLRDSEYETLAEGFEDGVRVSFMPSLGVELGYQIDSRFSAGIGHRWTYALHDQLEGQQWNNDNTFTSDNDKYHYTNLWLRWRIPSDKPYYSDPISDDNDPIRPIIPGPVVQITQPGSNPYQSSSNRIKVYANINHVESRNDVNVAMNGINLNNFNFNPNTDILEVTVTLNPGNNTLVISGSNVSGTASDQIRINFTDPIVEPPVVRNEPRVRITRPGSDPYTTENDRQRVEARIDYVAGRGDIIFTLNGQNITNFNFDNSTGFLTADVYLQAGNNYVSISASNSYGSDRDETRIIREEEELPPVYPPTVQITDPAASTYNTTQNTHLVRATIREIDSRNNINFRVNGRTIYEFSYNANTDLFSANVALNEGNNSISIIATNPDGQASDEVTIRYEAPQQDAPIVSITKPSSNPYTSTSAQTNVLASIYGVDSRNQVTVRLNGQNISNFSFNPQSGTLSTDISLSNGNNTVMVTATNAFGSDSDSRTIIFEAPLKRPTVKFTNPDRNPISVTKSSFTVKADITNIDNRNQIVFTFNGQPYSSYSFNPATGYFETDLVLAEGTNLVNIRVTNSAGSDEDSRGIMFNLPKPAPTVDITKPLKSPFTTSQASNSVLARITGIDNRNQIEFSLNGQRINNFSFNNATQQFSATLNLPEGNNTVLIRATNDNGSDEDSGIIRFVPPVDRPTVEITNPGANPFNTNFESTQIRARITGVDGRNNVSMSVNGTVFNNFGFSNNTLNANINLKPGNNTVVVSASNQGGSASDQTVIVYSKPVPLPKVTFTNPAQNQTTTDQESMTVYAIINHVDNRNNVVFTMNGQTITGFNYNVKTGKFNSSITLRPGNNNLTLTGSNSSGQASDNTQIIYRPKPKPTVQITTPRTNPFQTNNIRENVRASLTHVASDQDITILLNRNNISGFLYNPGSGQLSFTANLREGNNTISITVRNDAGTANTSTVINYQRPVSPPNVTVTNPEDKYVATDQGTFNFVASATQIDNKNQISFKVNGQNRPFNFNSSNGQITASIVLASGNNIVLTTATNSAGSDYKQVVIAFAAPPPPTQGNDPLPSGNGQNAAPDSTPDNTISRGDKSAPKIIWVSPGSKTIKSGAPAIKLNILNARNKSDITLNFNGTQVRAFSYNASSKQVSFSPKYRTGTNTLIVRVNNGKSTVEETFTVQKR